MLITTSAAPRSLGSKIAEPMMMALLTIVTFAGTIITIAPVA